MPRTSRDRSTRCTLVLVTPFDSMSRLARRHFPWLPGGLILRDRYDSLAHAPAVDARTTLLVGGCDQGVPPAHARALLAGFRPGVAQAVVLEGAGHNDVDLHPGYAQALRDVAGSPDADKPRPVP